MEIITKLYQILDIIHFGEIDTQQIEEIRFLGGQVLACQQFQQVPKVISTVKGNPMHIFVQHHARRHEKFAEAMRINTLFLILLEINPTLLQQLNGILCIDISIDVEFPEIELPDTVLIHPACGQIPILV